MKKFIKRMGMLTVCLWMYYAAAFPSCAEEEEVPQISLDFEKDIEVETNKGVKLTLSFEGISLTADDFTDDCIIDKDITKSQLNRYCTLSNPEAQCVIKAGKIIAKVSEVQDKNVNSTKLSSGNTCKKGFFDTETMKISSSAGSIDWIDAKLGNWGTYYVPDRFYITSGTYYTGVGAFLEWNGKRYLINIPVEVQCEDYIFLDQKDNPGEVFCYNGGGTGSVKYQPITTLYNATTTCSEDTYSVRLKEYNREWASASVYVPTFGYGASGVGATEISVNATSKNAFVAETPFAQMDEPYSFTVKNSMGKEKTYKLEVDMPWLIYNMYTKEIYVQIGETTYSTEAGKKVGQEVFSGTEVKMLFPVEEGNKLKSVTLLTGQNDMNGKAVDYKLQGNSIVFQMPKDIVTVFAIETEAKDLNDYSISVSTGLDGSDEPISGIVAVTDENKATINTAKEGDKVHLTAGKAEVSGNKYDYKFDHWEAEAGLIAENDLKKPEITFEMPAKNVSVKAVYVRTGIFVTAGTEMPPAGHVRLGITNIGLFDTSDSQTCITDQYRTGLKLGILLIDPNLEGYRFLGWKKADGSFWKMEDRDGITWNKVTLADGTCLYMYPEFTLADEGLPNDLTFMAAFEAKTACSLSVVSADASMGTVSAAKGEQSFSSGVVYEDNSLSLTAEAKEGYLFDKWQAEPAAGITFADAGAAETTCTIGEDVSAQATVTAVFKEDPNYKSSACEMTRVELIKSDKTLVKTADKEGYTFTIRLSAEDMTLEEAGKLTSGSYQLRITSSDKSRVGLDGGAQDGDPGVSWKDGVSNPIGKGGEGTFTVTAENGTTRQYTVAIRYDDRPVLTAGTVDRISESEAKVEFLSSSAGMYYYAVVDRGAAAPQVSTEGVGLEVKKANTAVKIALSGLTTGAKDIYIVVKNDDNAADIKISDALKITIPGFGAEVKRYSVSVSQAPGGTVTVDKSQAKEGETVKVTVKPDAGKQMKAGSLKFAWDQKPYTVMSINETTLSFTMPASGVSVSCLFENDGGSGPDNPANPDNPNPPASGAEAKILAFVANGVSGVINDQDGTITVILPYGTDLTRMPITVTVPAGVSISPAEGQAVDLSVPVTFTVTAPDGSSKTYRVSAYTEEQPKSEAMWEKMLENTGGSTDSSGPNTWWEKARKTKRKDSMPQYW